MHKNIVTKRFLPSIFKKNDAEDLTEDLAVPISKNLSPTAKVKGFSLEAKDFYPIINFIVGDRTSIKLSEKSSKEEFCITREFPDRRNIFSLENGSNPAPRIEDDCFVISDNDKERNLNLVVNRSGICNRWDQFHYDGMIDQKNYSTCKGVMNLQDLCRNMLLESEYVKTHKSLHKDDYRAVVALVSSETASLNESEEFIFLRKSLKLLRDCDELGEVVTGNVKQRRGFSSNSSKWKKVENGDSVFLLRMDKGDEVRFKHNGDCFETDFNHLLAHIYKKDYKESLQEVWSSKGFDDPRIKSLISSLNGVIISEVQNLLFDRDHREGDRIMTLNCEKWNVIQTNPHGDLLKIENISSNQIADLANKMSNDNLLITPSGGIIRKVENVSLNHEGYTNLLEDSLDFMRSKRHDFVRKVESKGVSHSSSPSTQVPIFKAPKKFVNIVGLNDNSVASLNGGSHH